MNIAMTYHILQLLRTQVLGEFLSGSDQIFYAMSPLIEKTGKVSGQGIMMVLVGSMYDIQAFRLKLRKIFIWQREPGSIFRSV